MNIENVFIWLEDWYLKQCDGLWEHGYGIHIGTIDNPGWHVRIDLKGTPVGHRTMNEVVIERNDDDWVHCKVINAQFDGCGGPRNLLEIITIFKKWVEQKV